MPHRKLLFGNDNIRTDHLKCDRCRTRVFLQSIEQSSGVEIRLFECGHCGALKSVRIASPNVATGWADNQASADRTSC